MDGHLPDGWTLEHMGPQDRGYVSECILANVLESVDGDRRALSDLWSGPIVELSMKQIENRGMDDEVLVLRKGGHRLGMLWIGSSNDQFTCDPTGYLLGIYVDPSVRRQGIGSALLRCAEDMCREKGYVTLTLNVGAPNSAALSFYSRNGFSVQTMVEQKLLR